MRRSASEIISNLETRIAGLEKQSSYTEREVIDAMSKFKNLYESGFMSKTDYEKHWSKLQDQLADFRLEDDENFSDLDDENFGHIDEDPSVPKVGDILYSSWGYNMTIVDFYKVIKVSPSGKSITLQELESETVGGATGWSGHVMPSRSVDRRSQPIKNKRVSPSRDGYSVKVNRSATAYKWDGKKKYFNRMD